MIPETKLVTGFLSALLLLALPSGIQGDEFPKLRDPRLQIQLFAESPDIVTPIGMTIDGRDRIFVVESHTHLPPSDYAGPTSDRIKLFVDRDFDGTPDRISIFAEGIREAMNLAVSPEGDLYVVCAREVLRLVDEDRDGVCDRQEIVLKLVTEERYAHNSLLGITFDRDGWMYVSRGNAGSHHYRIQGADETTVEGYGDGGNVVRCRPDGAQLKEFATGFWNPFDLKFDRGGRLLLVDNDPDARGPNRLLHVAGQGDYGYKSLYGGGGNHPFQGWDGSLPGTLPFIAGTGEAPSGLLDCRRSSFPEDYARSILVTIWNENSIEQFDVVPQGGTLIAREKSVFLAGSKEFRPVAIDCDSRGNLFITDWVLVNYPNHGRGRIWRVSCKSETDRTVPHRYFDPYPTEQANSMLSEVAATNDQQVLVDSLQDNDPFLRHAVHTRLADARFAPVRETLAVHPDPKVRLGALLASKRAVDASQSMLKAFLADRDETVRRAALLWAGEAMQPELRPHLESALGTPPAGAELFETYLAAVQNLDPEFIRAYRSRQQSRAQQIRQRLPAGVLLQVARSDRFSAEVRGMAIRRLDEASLIANRDWFEEQLARCADPLALSIIRRFAELSDEQRNELAETLTEMALGGEHSSTVRCESLLALSTLKVTDPRRILPLLRHGDPDIAVEAARTFRAWLDAGWARNCLDSITRMQLANEVKESLVEAQHGGLVGDESKRSRPKSSQEWADFLASGGDAGRGRRVFFTHRVGCAKCHTVDGRGGILGPDLSRVAQSKTRAQIVDAILDPSAEYPPQYQAWVVVTTDGLVHRGLQLDHKAGGAIDLIAESGEPVHFNADEIEDYGASPTSLMPSGLSETMTPGEFKDLVAFLESLTRS
jgi:putative membrane-bound dehydrogenase-like protein